MRHRLKDMKWSYLILPPQSAKSSRTRIAFNHRGTDCIVPAGDPKPVLGKAMMNAGFFCFVFWYDVFAASCPKWGEKK